MTPTKTFTFALPNEMKAALQLIRQRDGIAEAEQIRRGLQMWLNSKGVKMKPAPRRGEQTRRKA